MGIHKCTRDVSGPHNDTTATPRFTATSRARARRKSVYEHRPPPSLLPTARKRRQSVYQHRPASGVSLPDSKDSFRVFRKTEYALEQLGFEHEDDKSMQQRVLLRNLWKRLSVNDKRRRFVRNETAFI